MTRFGTKRIGALALAVAGITALAACSSSSNSSSGSTNNTTPGVTTQPGSIGGIPAAGTPSGKPGSITYGYLAADAPNWILPIIPAADNSVYNSFVFGWQMWRPTWFTWNGSSPAVNDSLSPVNAPTVVERRQDVYDDVQALEVVGRPDSRRRGLRVHAR